MGRKTSKSKKAATKPTRLVKNARRPAAKVARKPTARASKIIPAEAARQLDQVARDFDNAAEGLQISLETPRGTLPDLIAVEVRNDRARRMKSLASDGILHHLQQLATEPGADDGAGAEVVPQLRLTARMTLDHLCRAFEVEPVYRPGELLTVTRERMKEFDWSAAPAGDLNLPVEVRILQSGWKTAGATFVLPRVGRKD